MLKIVEIKQTIYDSDMIQNLHTIAKQVYEKCQQENNSTLQNLDLINNKITKNRELLEAKQILLVKEKNKIMTLDEDQIKFFLTQLKTEDVNDADYRNRLVNIFVNEIHLAETEVTVIFNVSKQKISLSVPITDKDKHFISAETSHTTTGSHKYLHGEPEGIRTPDPRLRRPVLYPTELLTHIKST